MHKIVVWVLVGAGIWLFLALLALLHGIPERHFPTSWSEFSNLILLGPPIFVIASVVSESCITIMFGAWKEMNENIRAIAIVLIGVLFVFLMARWTA